MADGSPAREDIFAMPRDDGRYYLYAPLRRSVALVNRGVVDAVASYMRDGPDAMDAESRRVIGELEDSGFLGGPAPDPPLFPSGYEFRPWELTLFPTSRCNLRCRYCYADAGRKSVDMPLEVARAAIDVVATNAGLLGNSKFVVGFHGGGEPTMAWDTLVGSVEYALKRADEMGLDVEVSAATNGVLSDEQRHYITKHFTSVNVSLDGPEDVQNHNRPKADGSGSFEEVRDTLKYFDDSGFHYGIRSTITAETVGRMDEIVEALGSQFNFAYFHLEPVWLCGRCLTSGQEPPSDSEFVERFVAAARKGREAGFEVTYSGARVGVLTSKFCAAPGDGFNVLPEGVVTSCYEVTEMSDPRAAIFHYGRYDRDSDSFVFDTERIASLQRLSVENIGFCADCFCKWHCAGDCLAKVFERSGSTLHEGSRRCDINRALTLASLDDILGDERTQ